MLTVMFTHHASSCTFYYLLSYLSGDMSVVLDTKVKEMVCEMSGKDDVSDPLCRGSIGYFCIKQCSVFASLFFAHTHIHLHIHWFLVLIALLQLIDFDLKYEFGDLSIELDKRVKNSVAQFCGKDTYSPGDLSRELAKRTSEGVLKYTGKDSYKVRSCVLSVFPIHILCCAD